jgi:AraC-like DNA-binding protein
MHQLNGNIMLTIIQALQLVGLVPSLFVILFLLTLIRSNQQVIVPILYFLALACCFALPLIDLVPFGRNNPWLKGSLLLGESMLVAFCFLLVMQFVLNRVPPLKYWLVLAIPLIGGSSIIFASLVQAGEVCLSERACYDIESIKTLYNIFASAFIFLLLIYYAGRGATISDNDVTRKHKYALIVSLILLHLFVLMADLSQLAERLTPADTLFATTMLKLTFIYLVITSLFRVFYPAMVSEVIQMAAPYVRAYNPELDRPHVEKIQSLLEIDHAYREMRLNRAALAKLVGINEHHLSRVINGHYGKNFNELINGYRIEEAKQRLKNEPDKQITVIGYEVGFNSIASFNRVFRDKVGMSPTDYRGV